jgi:hypothetical protein
MTCNRKTTIKLAYRNIIEVPEIDKDIVIQLLQKYLIKIDLISNRLDTTAFLKKLTYLLLVLFRQ